jgi:hypothetical protein
MLMTRDESTYDRMRATKKCWYPQEAEKDGKAMNVVTVKDRWMEIGSPPAIPGGHSTSMPIASVVER